MTTTIVAFGACPRFESMTPTAVLAATGIPSYGRVWRQHPSVPVLAGSVVLSGSAIDNNTGVSAVECRR